MFDFHSTFLALTTFCVHALLLTIKLPCAGIVSLYQYSLNLDTQALPHIFIMIIILTQCYGLSCMLLPPILYPFVTVLLSSYATLVAALGLYVNISDNSSDCDLSTVFSRCNTNVDSLLFPRKDMVSPDRTESPSPPEQFV